MKVLFKIKSGSHLYGLNTPTSDMESVFKYMECNSCKTEWDTCTYGLYCPECKSKDVHMALVWR